MRNIKKKLLVAIEALRSRPADLKKVFNPLVNSGKTLWPGNLLT